MQEPVVKTSTGFNSVSSTFPLIFSMASATNPRKGGPCPPDVRTKSRRTRRVSMLARADPPAILPNPYNALVLEANWAGAASTDFVMTVTTISDLILQQLGISLRPSQNLSYRILEVGIWELTGKGLEVAFHDLDARYAVDADYAPLTTKLDTPGRNHWSHLHYRWPLDNRNNALRASGDPANFQILAIKAGLETSGDARVKALVRVSWRTSQTETPGRVLEPTGIQMRAEHLNQDLAA